jgi:hypothetical protein
MAMVGAQRLIVLLLALTIGRFPVPWVHAHKLLRDEHLSTHLDCFHADAAEIPSLGWHVHLSCLGLSYRVPPDGIGLEDSSNGLILGGEQPEMFERESVATHQGSRKSQVLRLLRRNTKCTHVGDVPVEAFGDCSSHLSPPLPSETHLYYLYCSLLF